jgi:hypothetical protein
MVSSDDDMQPYAPMEDRPESLQLGDASRGRLHKSGHGPRRVAPAGCWEGRE